MNKSVSVNNQKCRKCRAGYITVDVYEEALCLNCGARPRGWVSITAKRGPDKRHSLPGEKWATSPGNPDLQDIRLPIHFERNSFATEKGDGRSELHQLPERRKLMVLTYLEESYSHLKSTWCTPIWVHPRKNDEEFEWRAYAVINLVNQFQKTFEEVIGKPLNHAQEFFESEREEWLKSLGVPSIQKKE
ncbi:MAG: hypothetical protein CL755_12515 [Chloroflexi bacterium]|nr:hypothetical protein [Chloroflexota bacterium]|tara:strand:+ start:5189 stop:5755 length:567 start_codon:yes stop_codon:yes gene_type:complete